MWSPRKIRHSLCLGVADRLVNITCVTSVGQHTIEFTSPPCAAISTYCDQLMNSPGRDVKGWPSPAGPPRHRSLLPAFRRCGTTDGPDRGVGSLAKGASSAADMRPFRFLQEETGLLIVPSKMVRLFLRSPPRRHVPQARWLPRWPGLYKSSLT